MTVERMVFDTFGQMWGPLLINCMTALCSLTGMVGVCIREKIAIGVVSENSALSIVNRSTIWVVLALKTCRVEFCNKQASNRPSSSIYNYTNIEGLLSLEIAFF